MRSLTLSILLGLLAFYTKQYFIACLGYVALYLFLADSKKRAIYFGLAALAASVVVLALVSYTSPYYMDATLYAVQSSAKMAASDKHLIPTSMQNSGVGTESLLESMQNIGVETEQYLNANYKKTAEITLPLVNRLGGGNDQIQIWKPIEVKSETDAVPSR